MSSYKRYPHQRHDLIRLLTHSLVLLLGAYLCRPQIAHAYIGVTLSTGALMIIGLLSFSILLALYVLVWFPIRRRLRRKTSTEDSSIQVQSTKNTTQPQSEHDRR